MKILIIFLNQLKKNLIVSQVKKSFSQGEVLRERRPQRRSVQNPRGGRRCRSLSDGFPVDVANLDVATGWDSTYQLPMS